MQCICLPKLMTLAISVFDRPEPTDSAEKGRWVRWVHLFIHWCIHALSLGSEFELSGCLAEGLGAPK